MLFQVEFLNIEQVSSKWKNILSYQFQIREKIYDITLAEQTLGGNNV